MGTTWTTSVTSVLIVGLVLVLVLLLELSTCDMFSIRFAAAANLCRHVVSVSINSYSFASPLTRRKLLLKTWLNPNSSFEEREASGSIWPNSQWRPDIAGLSLRQRRHRAKCLSWSDICRPAADYFFCLPFEWTLSGLDPRCMKFGFWQILAEVNIDFGWLWMTLETAPLKLPNFVKPSCVCIGTDRSCRSLRSYWKCWKHGWNILKAGEGGSRRVNSLEKMRNEVTIGDWEKMHKLLSKFVKYFLDGKQG